MSKSRKCCKTSSLQACISIKEPNKSYRASRQDLKIAFWKRICCEHNPGHPFKKHLELHTDSNAEREERRGSRCLKGWPPRCFRLQQEGCYLALVFHPLKKREFQNCILTPTPVSWLARENNIFLLIRAKLPISICPFSVSELHTEVPAAEGVLRAGRQWFALPWALAVLYPWNTSGWKQKWKDLGRLSCSRAQVMWSDFLMNMEARDLKTRSRFTEGLAQYVSGLLNLHCAHISVP